MWTRCLLITTIKDAIAGEAAPTPTELGDRATQHQPGLRTFPLRDRGQRRGGYRDGGMGAEVV